MKLLNALCLAALLGSTIARADAQTGTLTGKMAPFNYLTGSSWSCAVNVPAMMGQPSHTENSTVTFQPVPNNVMHVHSSSPGYSGDQYFGFAAQQNAYWAANAGSSGMAVTQFSNDGKSYSGTTMMGNAQITVHDTYTKLTDSHVTFNETAVVNGQNFVTTGDCKK